VNDLTDAGFAALMEKIARDKGFGCASYKEKCLRRRIAVRMRARGVHTYADYARVLDSDKTEYERLLDALTINVTKLFRNFETYTVMAEKVVPALWERDIPQINAWSAGCSSGEEPYSLAALFHRHAERLGALPELARRVRVLGSDIDARCLLAAETGAFAEGDFTDTPDDLRRRYFSPNPRSRSSLKYAGSCGSSGVICSRRALSFATIIFSCSSSISRTLGMIDEAYQPPIPGTSSKLSRQA